MAGQNEEFFDSLETRSTSERQDEQLGHLKALLNTTLEGSAGWRDTLEDALTEPLTDLSDLSRLPVRRKSEFITLQKQSPPLGDMNVTPVDQMSHLFASPGPIYEPDVSEGDYWRFGRSLFASGFRKGDLIHNTFSYHLTPAGFMAESGARALGCPVIAAGTGQTELQLQAIAHLQPSAYIGTPSFLRILLEKAADNNLSLSFTKALVSGEAFPPALAQQFSDTYGIHGFQCYATADVGLIAYETSAREGLVIDEHVIVEIVRPGTGDVVPDGEVGEVVVTSLNAHYPMIRFATGDLSMKLSGQSPCGRTNQRLKGWMGRADQTAKVRGMFVQPSQINQISQKLGGLKCRMVITRDADLRDVMTLQIETPESAGNIADNAIETVRSVTGLRADVRCVEPGSLANDGKVIDDQRPVET